LDVGEGPAAEIVAPVKEYSVEDTNDWSAVLHISIGKVSFLLTGDAEKKIRRGHG
jgi:competence protein ComEC